MDNRMIGAYVCVALGVLTLIFFFLTSLSNPGTLRCVSIDS